jgi:hypothetical protein
MLKRKRFKVNERCRSLRSASANQIWSQLRIKADFQLQLLLQQAPGTFQITIAFSLRM